MIEGYLQSRTMLNLYLIRELAISVLSVTFRAMKTFDLAEWLRKSAPSLLPSAASGNLKSEYDLGHDGTYDELSENYTMVLNRCVRDHEKACAESDEEMRAYSDLMQQGIPTHGHTAEAIKSYELLIKWNVEDFILSGAIMHILGSLEELERGLLGILFLYGTEGGTEDPSRRHIRPTLKDLSKSSPDWEGAENSKSLYSVSGRHALLASYAINAEPDSDWNSRLWSMRTDRNTLARSVSTLRHPFQTFLQVHYDAYRAVRHLAKEAMSAQGIVL